MPRKEKYQGIWTFKIYNNKREQKFKQSQVKEIFQEKANSTVAAIVLIHSCVKRVQNTHGGWGGVGELPRFLVGIYH